MAKSIKKHIGASVLAAGALIGGTTSCTPTEQRDFMALVDQNADARVAAENGPFVKGEIQFPSWGELSLIKKDALRQELRYEAYRRFKDSGFPPSLVKDIETLAKNTDDQEKQAILKGIAETAKNYNAHFDYTKKQVGSLLERLQPALEKLGEAINGSGPSLGMDVREYEASNRVLRESISAQRAAIAKKLTDSLSANDKVYAAEVLSQLQSMSENGASPNIRAASNNLAHALETGELAIVGQKQTALGR